MVCRVLVFRRKARLHDVVRRVRRDSNFLAAVVIKVDFATRAGTLTADCVMPNVLNVL